MPDPNEPQTRPEKAPPSMRSAEPPKLAVTLVPPLKRQFPNGTPFMRMIDAYEKKKAAEAAKAAETPPAA